MMNIIHAKNSTGIMAGITGLLFAVLTMGLEILTENPGATNSISIWHFPLIWLLAGINPPSYKSTLCERDLSDDSWVPGRRLAGKGVKYRFI